ncbi:hypothetical protein [Nocardioides sp. B-3]|uniref:hypothetical protein n=1 Tax=Nocardioides sp. B-3 TaxID=2895565 RepID=UPI0021533EA0|nr:hypothetical protein [Nocardioides sp. B-3]UUZ57890.1 hypothetical protein LP418_16105 [Nocardioides sp. B-3]
MSGVIHRLRIASHSPSTAHPKLGLVPGGDGFDKECPRALVTSVHDLNHHGIDQSSDASYLGRAMSGPIIVVSALKHGLTKEEILHAYRHPVRVWDLGDGFTMIVGPNQAAIFPEVGYVDGGETFVIVHAMKAREKFLR